MYKSIGFTAQLDLEGGKIEKQVAVLTNFQ